jgi:TM2 domain-containing membrane protein YozV
MNQDRADIQSPTATTSPSNPWFAAILSAFLPGAGQAYNGRFWKGALLLILSFLILPIGAVCFAYIGGLVSYLILVPLLVPWLYSMVDAAREANRPQGSAGGIDPARGAIYVSILLLVVFPIVATLFSVITLFLLPIDVLLRINDWTAGFRQASGLGG